MSKQLKELKEHTQYLIKCRDYGPIDRYDLGDALGYYVVSVLEDMERRLITLEQRLENK